MSFLNLEPHHVIDQIRFPSVAVATDPEKVIEILDCLAVSHLQPLEAEPIDGRNILELLRPLGGRLARREIIADQRNKDLERTDSRAYGSYKTEEPTSLVARRQ
jgi:hypothetical protein